MLNESEKKIAIAIFSFFIIILSSIVIFSVAESDKFQPQGRVIIVDKEIEIEYKGVQDEN